MGDPLGELRSRLKEIHHLGMAGAVLDWDQQTYMPPGAVSARAEQRATLSRLAHDFFVDDRTGRLLDAAAEAVAGADPESDDAALVRVTRRDREKAVRLPSELVEEFSRVTSLAQEEWAKARAADDYAAFAPWLERIVDLERRTAEALGYEDRLYDALLDQYEPGTTSRQVEEVFEELKQGIVPLARAIFERLDAVDDACLHREYPEALQQSYTEKLLAELGFDFQRGRQDRAVHPFCTSFSCDDVRLTTRYDPAFLPSCLFGSLHEMGHGLYEQGLGPELSDTPLSGGASLGVHESQSRLWENLVGRSRPFWRCHYAGLQAQFPSALGDTGAEDFYRAINRVSRGLIRVEADEVTYNLHIILRYEMENELLEGRLSIADAPDAWRARMEQYLGVTPPSNRLGILQDVHWSCGIMGYFPTYCLGTVMSVQLYEAAMRDANIRRDADNGEYASLLDWLRVNVHRCGRKLLPGELLRRATGSPLAPAPYLNYLKTKFQDLYDLD